MPADRVPVDTPSEPAEVVRRYHRTERIASGALALLAGGLVAATVLWLPLLQAAVASLVVLAVVRVPAFRSYGAARLATEADPEAAYDDFAGPTPPVLATQWGVADEVRRTDEEAIYGVSYLFGLRTIEMAVEARETRGDGGGADGPGVTAEERGGDDADLVLGVNVGGEPWATYAVSVEEHDGGTVVDVEFAADRRYGLRRLPQWLVTRHYRDEVLAAQGYAVIERDVGLTV